MSDSIEPIILQRYETVAKIGQGAYGQVWEAKDRVLGTKVALKKIYDAYRNNLDAQIAYREVMYSKQFQHPNLVKLYSFHTVDHSKDIYLSMELMDCDLQQIINKSAFDSAFQKYHVFYQLVNALEYLHNANLVHRDLKPANVLLSHNWETKICDFGLLRSVKNNKTQQESVMTENIATRWYRAPQILLGSNSYGQSVDIWSLGCILAEMLTGKILFQGESALDQLQKVLEVTGKPDSNTLKTLAKSQTTLVILQSMNIKEAKNLKKLLSIDDDQLVDLMSKMFELNPEKRITIPQIKKHPFFFKVKKTLLLNNKKLRFQPTLKNPKPISINFENEKLSAKKYANLLNLFSDPIQFEQDWYHLQRSEAVTLTVPIQIRDSLPTPDNLRTIEANQMARHKFAFSTVSFPTNNDSTKTSPKVNQLEISEFHRTHYKSPNSSFRAKQTERTYTNEASHKLFSINDINKIKTDTCQTFDRSPPKRKLVKSPNFKIDKFLSPKRLSPRRLGSPKQFLSPKKMELDSNNGKNSKKGLWMPHFSKRDTINPKQKSNRSDCKRISQGYSFTSLFSNKKTMENQQQKRQKEERAYLKNVFTLEPRNKCTNLSWKK